MRYTDYSQILMGNHEKRKTCEVGFPENLFIYLFIVFCIFRATRTACGGSQARGHFGAVAAGLHHSSWQQRRILNPLSEARD